MGEGPVLEGRIDLVRGQWRPRCDNDDPSVPAEFRHPMTAGQAQHGPAQDRVPEPQAGLPSRCWPAACRRGGRPHTGRRWSSLRGWPFDGRWRHPRGRSSNHRTASPAWCRRGSRRPIRPWRAAGSTGRGGPSPTPRSGRWSSLARYGVDGDLGPVRAEGQVIRRPRPGPGPARLPGRQVVDERRSIAGGTGRSAGCPG